MKRKASRPISKKSRNVKSDSRVNFLQRKLAHPVSPRELEVLIAIGNGKTSRQISAELNISGKTLNTYIQRLKQKLEVDNFNQLIRAAALLVEGIVPSEPNESNGRSLRICRECRKLFSVKRADESIPELAGYRVLNAVLRANDRG